MHRSQPRSSRLEVFNDADFEVLSNRLHEHYHMPLDEINELKGRLENCNKCNKEFLLRLRGEGGREGTQHRSMVQLYGELQAKKKALADTISAEDVSASIRYISSDIV
jgi:hypothetical protein